MLPPPPSERLCVPRTRSGPSVQVPAPWPPQQGVVAALPLGEVGAAHMKLSGPVGLAHLLRLRQPLSVAAPARRLWGRACAPTAVALPVIALHPTPASASASLLPLGSVSGQQQRVVYKGKLLSSDSWLRPHRPQSRRHQSWAAISPARQLQPLAVQCPVKSPRTCWYCPLSASSSGSHAPLACPATWSLVKPLARLRRQLPPPVARALVPKEHWEV
mmetsp:Transcript_21505/g.50064  ORF Transcript_21505/g.50064 Transcript_21505/m.50064 type:complete len:217 (+) Transcript_21505:73-723(+)